MERLRCILGSNLAPKPDETLKNVDEILIRNWVYNKYYLVIIITNSFGFFMRKVKNRTKLVIFEIRIMNKVFYAINNGYGNQVL